MMYDGNIESVWAQQMNNNNYLLLRYGFIVQVGNVSKVWQY